MDDSDEFEFEVDPLILERMPWLETQLDPKSSRIRVLKLHEETGDNPISCSLQTVSLDDNPEYETLSYVWGDPKKTKPITIGGEVVQATENLVDFLICLRRQGTTGLIWADALCIDQTNEEEKIRQIALMTRVYRQAKKAHIWFGHFTPSWVDEIQDDSSNYIPACKLTPSQWYHAEEGCREELGQFLRAGGKPQVEKEATEIDTDIMSQLFIMLDEVAGGKHFHEFPLFYLDKNHRSGHVMNRNWIKILDCFQWLLSRPWWTRVWTLQEAVLPGVDPIIHAYPYSFELSRLLNGLKAKLTHTTECCKSLTRLFGAAYLRSSSFGYARAWDLHQLRERFSELDPPRIPIEEAIDAARGRNATAPQDHFFGILGLLPPEWIGYWYTTFGYSCSIAQVFSQCTKLLYTNSDSLSRLGEARGLQSSMIPDLPSWAMDLSTQIPPSHDGNQRWELFNACRQSKFSGFKTWDNLTGLTLAVRAIPIGTVSACAEPLSAYDLNILGSNRASSLILRRVAEWQKLYTNLAKPAELDGFWRTAFMDRDIWRYYMHERRPLQEKRLVDIKQWWENCIKTGDPRDLTMDNQYANSRLGDYHYRALRLNFEKHRFLCTKRGEPGMGPMEANPSDEIFVLQGCQAPAILRRRSASDGKEGFHFVGLCFVDRWMYGEATLGMPEWQTLTLY